ncbi:MAG TPA: arginine deiminase family protein [Gemmatimonadales bacterium]|nr:arginine deiminase family protein [Gemmatimonadales bacterium]
MPPVRVTSEIGPLQAVLVHTPGLELEAVTPGNREDYLYDDLIGLEVSAREHALLKRVLSRFATVHEVSDLVSEVLEQQEAREYLIGRALAVVPSEPLAQQLGRLPPRTIVRMLIEGTEEEPGPIARALNETGFVFPPLPNLFFPRDTGMVIGSHVVVGSMRYRSRWTEELLIKTLFAFHPGLANAGILYDGSEERRANYTLEGGDVHVLREDLLLVGFSERSSPGALDQLADVAFERAGVGDVIVVVMPANPTAIHLDMLFTHVDRDLCLVYPPAFIGPERLTILHRKKGDADVREQPDLFTALAQTGMPLEPVLAGGPRRLTQEREQWASGCNALALAPGVIVTYARNEETLGQLGSAGFRIVPSGEFLGDETGARVKGRTAITLEGGELVRGGGGARCMTLPIHRREP